MQHLKNLNRTVLHLFLTRKIVTSHKREAVAFLGTSPSLWFKRFPEILLLVLSFCSVAAWSPLTCYCNNATPSPTHPESKADIASSSLPPGESLATDTSRGTIALNTTLDSWFFSCVHCCHGHVFTVVLMGVGFTPLILPTERKCHEFNLWSLTLVSPASVC